MLLDICPAGAMGGDRGDARPVKTFTKIGQIMINNSAPQKWQRLQRKQLDQQFISEVRNGCNCSPFEAEAILETVNKVYGAFFDNSSTIQPGQIQLTVISCEARISSALSEAPMVTVTLTMTDDGADLDIRQKHGIVALRQHRLQRICTEAVQQGGLLTVEDLANRLFNCGERTLCRDIKQMKDKGIILPLRSTVKDMGRTLSHRADIVRHWLLGKEYSQIGRDTFHSAAAVHNYIDKFKRVVSLSLAGCEPFTIAFLVRLSSNLVKQYLELYQTLDIVAHRKEELDGMSKKNLSPNPKK